MASPTRLDVHLTRTGLFSSRARAAAAIEAGLVAVNGVTAEKAGARPPAGAVITVAEHASWVGRGALKLLGALNRWPIEVERRVCLDVGASRGGFTEVLLSRGAARVYAVDVGRGQLHPTLANDPRVVAMEGVDARSLERPAVPDPLDLVVCDASFIGLAKVLPAALGLARQGADLVALVKPQFEVGPERVGKGGLVRDPVARAEAVADVSTWLGEIGWPVREQAESPLTGADGNVETLVWAVRA